MADRTAEHRFGQALVGRQILSAETFATEWAAYEAAADGGESAAVSLSFSAFLRERNIITAEQAEAAQAAISAPSDDGFGGFSVDPPSPPPPMPMGLDDLDDGLDGLDPLADLGGDGSSFTESWGDEAAMKPADAESPPHTSSGAGSGSGSTSGGSWTGEEWNAADSAALASVAAGSGADDGADEHIESVEMPRRPANETASLGDSVALTKPAWVDGTIDPGAWSETQLDQPPGFADALKKAVEGVPEASKMPALPAPDAPSPSQILGRNEEEEQWAVESAAWAKPTDLGGPKVAVPPGAEVERFPGSETWLDAPPGLEVEATAAPDAKPPLSTLSRDPLMVDDVFATTSIETTTWLWEADDDGGAETQSRQIELVKSVPDVPNASESTMISIASIPAVSRDELPMIRPLELIPAESDTSAGFSRDAAAAAKTDMDGLVDEFDGLGELDDSLALPRRGAGLVSNAKSPSATTNADLDDADGEEDWLDLAQSMDSSMSGMISPSPPSATAPPLESQSPEGAPGTVPEVPEPAPESASTFLMSPSDIDIEFDAGDATKALARSAAEKTADLAEPPDAEAVADDGVAVAPSEAAAAIDAVAAEAEAEADRDWLDVSESIQLIRDEEAFSAAKGSARLAAVKTSADLTDADDEAMKPITEADILAQMSEDDLAATRPIESGRLRALNPNAETLADGFTAPVAETPAERQLDYSAFDDDDELQSDSLLLDLNSFGETGPESTSQSAIELTRADRYAADVDGPVDMHDLAAEVGDEFGSGSDSDVIDLTALPRETRDISALDSGEFMRNAGTAESAPRPRNESESVDVIDLTLRRGQIAHERQSSATSGPDDVAASASAGSSDDILSTLPRGRRGKGSLSGELSTPGSAAAAAGRLGDSLRPKGRRKSGPTPPAAGKTPLGDSPDTSSPDLTLDKTMRRRPGSGSVETPRSNFSGEMPASPLSLDHTMRRGTRRREEISDEINVPPTGKIDQTISRGRKRAGATDSSSDIFNLPATKRASHGGQRSPHSPDATQINAAITDSALGPQVSSSGTGSSSTKGIGSKLGFKSLVELAGSSAPSSGKISRYSIKGQLGRGGMGEVLRVQDPDLNRNIACKVMLPNLRNDPIDVEKFLVEAQVTGQLEHPNIVPVHELGMAEDGRVFFTMKHVKGRSMQEILAEMARREKGEPAEFAEMRDYSLVELLEAFLKICDAMSFAHANGVIHRDLKPENVMMGEFGEVLVMDWGLAKIKGVEDKAARGVKVDLDVTQLSARLGQSGKDLIKTMDGEVLGTPSYMPPEQARGEISEIDHRSDLYSLGAILYQILTLETPVMGKTAIEILGKVSAGQVIKPTERAPQRKISPELEAVTMKAMAHKKEKRYASVPELQADIRAFLEGRALSAVNYSLLSLTIKWIKRNKTLSLMTAILIVVAAGITGVFLELNRQTMAEREASIVALLGEAQEMEKQAFSIETDAKQTVETTIAARREIDYDGVAGRYDEALTLVAGALEKTNQVLGLKSDHPQGRERRDTLITLQAAVNAQKQSILQQQVARERDLARLREDMQAAAVQRANARQKWTQARAQFAAALAAVRAESLSFHEDRWRETSAKWPVAAAPMMGVGNAWLDNLRRESTKWRGLDQAQSAWNERRARWTQTYQDAITDANNADERVPRAANEPDLTAELKAERDQCVREWESSLSQIVTLEHRRRREQEAKNLDAEAQAQYVAAIDRFEKRKSHLLAVAAQAEITVETDWKLVRDEIAAEFDTAGLVARRAVEIDPRYTTTQIQIAERRARVLQEWDTNVDTLEQRRQAVNLLRDAKTHYHSGMAAYEAVREIAAAMADESLTENPDASAHEETRRLANSKSGEAFTTFLTALTSYSRASDIFERLDQTDAQRTSSGTGSSGGSGDASSTTGTADVHGHAAEALAGRLDTLLALANLAILNREFQLAESWLKQAEDLVATQPALAVEIRTTVTETRETFVSERRIAEGYNDNIKAGREAYSAGAFALAIENFMAARSILDTPELRAEIDRAEYALRIDEARDASGRSDWRRAHERYLDAVRFTVDNDDRKNDLERRTREFVEMATAQLLASARQALATGTDDGASNAQESLKLAVELSPGNEEIQSLLGEVIARQNRPEGFVYVPRGRTALGSTRESDRNPARTADVGPFYMATREVTVGEYREFIANGGYTRREFWSDAGWAFIENLPDGERWPANWAAQTTAGLPVVGVSAFEVEAYCKWLSAKNPAAERHFRLPTDEEWETVARHAPADRLNVGRNYPWGNDWDGSGIDTTSGGGGKLVPVGSNRKDVSLFGCADMGGNACEWVLTGDEQLPYGLRGASNRMSLPLIQRFALTTKRGFALPSTRRDDVGFRLVQDVPRATDSPQSSIQR